MDKHLSKFSEFNVDKHLYTIGAKEVYDNIDGFKSKGGSVWKDIKSIKDYFNKIDGKVIYKNKDVDAGIYLIDANWDNDVNKEDDFYGTLNRPAKIIGSL